MKKKSNTQENDIESNALPLNQSDELEGGMLLNEQSDNTEEADGSDKQVNGMQAAEEASEQVDIKTTGKSKRTLKTVLPRVFIALVVAVLITVVLFFTLTQGSANAFLMGTDVTLTSKGLDALPLNAKIIKEIERADSLLSPEKENSDVYRINRAPSGEWLNVDALTITLLKTAIEFQKQSDGAFNVFLYPVVKAWKFDAQGFTVKEKTMQEIEEMQQQALALSPYVTNDFSEREGILESENFVIDTRQNRIMRKNEISQIDFGAMAKGYAADFAFRAAQESNIEHLLCVLGGSSIAGYGRDYRIGVADPQSPDEKSIAEILISDNGISTSGIYRRSYFDENGKRYHHIIGQNLRPADNGIVSVSVAGENAMICDFLSTAAVILGDKKAIELVIKYGYGIFIVFDDNTYKIAGNIDCYVTDQSYRERI